MRKKFNASGQTVCFHKRKKKWAQVEQNGHGSADIQHAKRPPHGLNYVASSPKNPNIGTIFNFGNNGSQFRIVSAGSIATERCAFQGMPFADPALPR
jgi:hypothetical protein